MLTKKKPCFQLYPCNVVLDARDPCLIGALYTVVIVLIWFFTEQEELVLSVDFATLVCHALVDPDNRHDRDRGRL